MQRVRLFYDSEFTGLTQATTLISMALVAEDGHCFYAEFTDLDVAQIDDFVRDSVLVHTHWLANVWFDREQLDAMQSVEINDGQETRCFGDRKYIRQRLIKWLKQFGTVEIWADHVSYDWVLFCELFDGALSLPDNIHWIPRDFCTFLECNGYDPDIDRVKFAQEYSPVPHNEQHNALFDARITLSCYQRINHETQSAGNGN